MADKQFSWKSVVAIFVWILLIVGVILLLLWVVYPFFSTLPEWHFYVRLALVFLFIITFGVLRLYNAIVGNTRFLIKLRETVGKIQNIIPGMEREMRNLTSTLGTLRSGAASLQKTLKDNSEKVAAMDERLKERISQVKSARSGK